MKLYNTLSRSKENFEPIDKSTAKMYSCGPTVYNYAHIGNLRTYVFMDLLRRTIKYNGFSLLGVMNITDVGHLLSDADEGEDKMQKAAREQQKSPYEIADYYTSIFESDLQKLNIEMPEIVPKATDHIKEMLKFVYELFDNGYAYETSDGIYFDISRFDEYGKLSRLDLDEQIAGARVEVNAEKRHPADFALWKKAPKEHIMQWDSRWGKGYPGWHIECSAMAKKYLGEVFDIHTGGVDHIPVHHENEIAQSQALTGKSPSKFWIHSEFMLVDNGKMSKKLGNTYTLTQLAERGYSPMEFRYFCLNAHYRKKLNFTFTGMDAAKVSYSRLCALILKHKQAAAKNEIAFENAEDFLKKYGGEKQAEQIHKYLKAFEDNINDDLNIPGALAYLWTMLKDLVPSKLVYHAALKMDSIFGLCLNAVEAEAKQEADIPSEIIEIAEKRLLARENKDFAESDKLRELLSQKGYNIKDLKGAYELEKKS